MNSPGPAHANRFRESFGASFSETAIRPATSMASTAFSSPPPSATEPNWLSPLENPSTGVERSIIGLSLGGETLG